METFQLIKEVVNKFLEDPLHFWEVPMLIFMCTFFLLMFWQVTKDDF
tara:strand:- start:939 stop:1079 length:141 start_codon:yes stop_codon:yes gene_type:complete